MWDCYLVSKGSPAEVAFLSPAFSETFYRQYKEERGEEVSLSKAFSWVSCGLVIHNSATVFNPPLSKTHSP